MSRRGVRRAVCGGVVPALPVHVLAVAHAHDKNQENRVMDFIEDAVGFSGTGLDAIEVLRSGSGSIDRWLLKSAVFSTLLCPPAAR